MILRLTCEGITITAIPQAIVGNARVLKGSGQILSNVFFVGLSGGRQFNNFAEGTLEAIVNVSGFFAL